MANKRKSWGSIQDDTGPKAKPFIKWAGGKTQILKDLLSCAPPIGDINTYYEPFLGGGALFFKLQPNSALLSDTNHELINAYKVIKTHVKDLIEELERSRKYKNDKEVFIRIRKRNPDKISKIERAARFIYLNKTCFNGLYRVNKKGEFNVPFGSNKNPKILDKANLLLVSQILKGKAIRCWDYKKALEYVEDGDFIYLDPPYQPISATSSFTNYTKDSFSRDDQIELSKTIHDLNERVKCKIMFSNSKSSFINGLYGDFERIVNIKAKRMISCKGDGRGSIGELLIMNYGR